MQRISSFIGKCFTVLLGIGLSWATVTNPQFNEMAAAICGGESAATVALPSADQAWDDANLANAEFETDEDVGFETSFSSKNMAPAVFSQTPAGAPDRQLTESQQIESISSKLKGLGATYLRLEKLSQKDEVWYRVRCDLVEGRQDVKCCFEATRRSAVDAMQDVLQAVENGLAPNVLSTTG